MSAHRPTESAQIFRASPFFHGATQARLRSAVPIRQAFGSRVDAGWEILRTVTSASSSTLQDGRVGVDAAVPQERPVAAESSSIRDGSHSTIRISSLSRGGFREHLAKWITDERVAPEFETALRRAFVAHSIHRSDEHSVGDRVGALNGAPRIELRYAEFPLLGGMPANRRGIEENVCPGEARKARALRIPLVPAHQHTDASEACVEIRKSEVARREIKLLSSKADHPGCASLRYFPRSDPSPRPESAGGIVIQASRAALEQRADDRDIQAPRKIR